MNFIEFSELHEEHVEIMDALKKTMLGLIKEEASKDGWQGGEIPAFTLVELTNGETALGVGYRHPASEDLIIMNEITFGFPFNYTKWREPDEPVKDRYIIQEKMELIVKSLIDDYGGIKETLINIASSLKEKPEDKRLLGIFHYITENYNKLKLKHSR